MMSKIALPLLLIALCAACGEAPPAVNKGAPLGEDPFQARLAAMPAGQRNGVFIRAIRDARQECQSVDSSAPAPPVRGRPVWTAVCQGGQSYTLVILPDGVVQVVNDAEASLVPDNAAAPRQR